MASSSLDSERNQLLWKLLIVLTLMFLTTFLFVFFVTDNFNSPCTTNQGTGPIGIRGKTGAVGMANDQTGPQGFAGQGIGPTGPQPGTAADIPGATGPTGPVSGFGYPGAPGSTGAPGPAGFDGLVSGGIQFAYATAPNAVVSKTLSTNDLDFYSQLQFTISVSASFQLSTDSTATTTAILTRTGSVVTLNIFPFLLYKVYGTPDNQYGQIFMPLFVSDFLPLTEYAPSQNIAFPILVSIYKQMPQQTGTGNGTSIANVDTPGILLIAPGNGITIYGNWTCFTGTMTVTLGIPPTYSIVQNITNSPGAGQDVTSALSFNTANSPWGLQSVISVQWMVG